MAFCLLVLCWEVGSPPAPKNFKKGSVSGLVVCVCACLRLRGLLGKFSWQNILSSGQSNFQGYICHFYENKRRVGLNSAFPMFMPSLNLSLQKNSHAIYDVLKEDRREMKYFV